jgi:hypothetical protein
MKTLYQPYRIINNKPNPINARGFDSEQEAMDYAVLERGYDKKDIIIKESQQEEFIFEWR